MSESLSFSAARKALRFHASKKKAAGALGFFKSGKGEYGEGDVFIGVTVPQMREIAKKFVALPDASLVRLLGSPIHEERYLALLIWTYQIPKADGARRKEIARLYWANRKGVNNWDLVDTSAHLILSPVYGPAILPRLKSWARSGSLWEKRIAMVATLHFTRLGAPRATLIIAKILLKDKHDLLQKAAGWMLREVGNYCGQPTLKKFLRKNYRQMGRTALRYSIEKFSEKLRQRYLKGRV